MLTRCDIGTKGVKEYARGAKRVSVQVRRVVLVQVKRIFVLK